MAIRLFEEGGKLPMDLVEVPEYICHAARTLRKVGRTIDAIRLVRKHFQNHSHNEGDPYSRSSLIGLREAKEFVESLN